MSRPKPPPPPRPDLEEESDVDHGPQSSVTPSSETSPKPSKRLPPPIPLRPDLGEGIDKNVHVPSPRVPKIPPPVMEKRPKHSKPSARPEITIISAQPMASPGNVSPPSLAPVVPSHPEQPPTESPSVLAAPAPQHATTPEFISPIPSPPVLHSQPATTSGINKPVAIYQQATSPSGIIDTAPPPSTVPSEPMISPLRPAPLVPSKPISPLSPSSPDTASPSPNRIRRTPKNREPPQRPKSKPVCELPGEEYCESMGIMTTSINDNPVAPKRKKNKPDKSKDSFFDSSSGIQNSAFFESESIEEEDSNMVNNDINKTASSTKQKAFPTVIRTKPNGKDKTSVNQDTFQQFDNSKTEVVQAKSSKPTVIKPEVKLKSPPPAAKKASQQNENIEIPPPVTPFVQHAAPDAPVAKPKNKPTVIIPKAKKDGGNTSKNEGIENKAEESKVVSPSDKPMLEIQDKKSNKTKKIPSIIRPNKLKKDTDNVEGFRGTPEGESSQNQARKGPVRKAPAPPRPGPPKPAPPRPGPPRRAAPEEPKTSIEAANFSVKFEAHPRAPAPSKPQPEQVKESHAPVPKHKTKRPRPATIGKDKETEEHKNNEKMKKKEEEKKEEEKKNTEPAVSSVVSTKIEPSAIALYDYVPTSIDDLSFKAGDEIFLIKRVNHEWYIGRCGECEGMMPVKFVEIIEDLPPESEEPSSSHNKASHQTSELLSTLALYHFDAQSSDELTLHAGDTVHLLEMINDEWLKGQIGGKTGIFPTGFVEFNDDIKHKLKQKQSSKLTAPKLTVSSGPRCKAVYDYDSGNPDDLTFKTGDVIQIIERINAEWLKGEVHGATGMFPVTFIEIIEDLEASASSPLPVTTALHDYESNAKGDLSFRKGDRITIIEKINDDWLEGELNGQKGMLPSAYVEHVELSGSTQHHKVPGHKVKPQEQLLPKGKALYDFTAETENELTFKAGDEIILLKYINNEWMEGELNNDIGQFPVAFIEILVPLP